MKLDARMISSVKVSASKFNCNAEELIGFTWDVDFFGDIYTWKIVGVNAAYHIVDYSDDIRGEYWEIYIEHDGLRDDIDVINEVIAHVLPFVGHPDPEE